MRKRSDVEVESKTGIYSYEDAMVAGIIDGNGPRVGEEALLIGAVIESLTPSLRVLSTESGRQIGRVVFKHMQVWKRKNDMLERLADFFAKAGYTGAACSTAGGSASLKIYKSNHVNVGGNIHHAEAGMAAGFIGAALGTPFNAVETECCNNGGESCTFEVGRRVRVPGHIGEVSLDRYISHLGHDSLESSCSIADSYMMLGAAPLLSMAYESHMKTLLYYIGSAASRGRISAIMAKGRDERVAEALKIASALGFGAASRAGGVVASFSGARARSDFATIASGFVSGALAEATGRGHQQVSCTNRGGIYMVAIKDSEVTKRRRT